MATRKKIRKQRSAHAPRVIAGLDPELRWAVSSLGHPVAAPAY